MFTLDIKEIKLKIRIVAFQFFCSIVMFCINRYLIGRYMMQYEDIIIISSMLMFVVECVIICNYIITSKKIVLTSIFSAITWSIISELSAYAQYILGLSSRYGDVPLFITFTAGVLISILLFSCILFIIYRIAKKKWTPIISTESNIYKKIELLFMISIIPLIGFICYCSYVNNSPEKVLKKQFNISLDDFDYTVEFKTHNETGIPVNDTYFYFKLNNLTQKNIDYLLSKEFKQLPLPDSVQVIINDIRVPISISKSDNDYYKYSTFQPNCGYYLYDSRSCCGLYNKFFIINTKKNIAILYYQIM